MSSAAEGWLRYKIANAPIRDFPYPHIYVTEVFPPEVYAGIQASLPDPAAMVPIASARPVTGYEERFVLDVGKHADRLSGQQREFWEAMDEMLTRGALKGALLAKFGAAVEKRFAGQGIKVSQETLLVQDVTHYSLGPHTDAPEKLVTVLFYLPKDESQTHLGTSIYVPKQKGWTCLGGPHYGYEGFDRVATMPFKPNSMFAFVKTDNSFHGVEPVEDREVRRWLLLYDIKWTRVEA